jgi:transposase InsO family protein
VWLLEHDILPVYSDPGHPEQNGRHERMHRELKAEAARPPASNKTLEQRKLNAFVDEYNVSIAAILPKIIGPAFPLFW